MSPDFFTEDDEKKVLEFGSMFAEKAVFNGMSVSDVIKLSRCLVWYNSLPKKIADHICEVKKVVKKDEHGDQQG